MLTDIKITRSGEINYYIEGRGRLSSFEFFNVMLKDSSHLKNAVCMLQQRLVGLKTYVKMNKDRLRLINMLRNVEFITLDINSRRHVELVYTFSSLCESLLTQPTSRVSLITLYHYIKFAQDKHVENVNVNALLTSKVTVKIPRGGLDSILLLGVNSLNVLLAYYVLNAEDIILDNLV